MTRFLLAATFAGSILFGATTHALAAKPRIQACMGTTVTLQVSEFGGRGFGQDAAGTARESGGLGPIIQAFQAGQIPDELEPNTCNDSV